MCQDKIFNNQCFPVCPVNTVPIYLDPNSSHVSSDVENTVAYKCQLKPNYSVRPFPT